MTRFDEGYKKALQGLELARETGDREHEAGFLSGAIPLTHIRNGDFNAARSALSEGLQIAERIGALYPQVDASWLLAQLALWQGDYETALEYGQRALAAALPLEDYLPFQVVPSLSTLGTIYLEISPKFTDKIAEFHQHALRLLENPIGAISGAVAWADLGFCALALGDLQLATETIQKGLNYPTMFSQLERARLLAGAALLALARNQLDETTHLVVEAREYAEERRMRQLYPLISLVAGKIHMACGELAAGLSAFESAESEALSLEMRPIVWQARLAAADALTATGQHDQAQNRRAAARETMDEIAGLFEDEDLRSVYLQNIQTKIPG
jgi:tetratricopeptide (TPR) repeat protein